MVTAVSCQRAASIFRLFEGEIILMMEAAGSSGTSAKITNQHGLTSQQTVDFHWIICLFVCS
jgi:hypothetical protein